MNPDKRVRGVGEDALAALLRNHYVAVAIPQPFKEALYRGEIDQQYQRLHREQPKRAAWKSVLARRQTQAIAASLSFALVVVLLGIFVLSTPRDVLAQTARALDSVKTFHYKVRMPGLPSQGVREIWTRGSRVYRRLELDGETVGEFWMDANRIVTYDPARDRVETRDASPELHRALEELRVIREFRPRDWQSLPPERIEHGGRTYQVFAMPGTGTFRGLGREGETRMKLWIDEATYLPARLIGELKPSGG